MIHETHKYIMLINSVKLVGNGNTVGFVALLKYIHSGI